MSNTYAALTGTYPQTETYVDRHLCIQRDGLSIVEQIDGILQIGVSPTEFIRIDFYDRSAEDDSQYDKLPFFYITKTFFPQNGMISQIIIGITHEGGLYLCDDGSPYPENMVRDNITDSMLDLAREGLETIQSCTTSESLWWQRSTRALDLLGIGH
jgi:hypothetical protein